MNEGVNDIVGVDDNDSCLLFVSNLVLKTMKMKYEKWMKMMAIDEYKVSLQTFINVLPNLISKQLAIITNPIIQNV